MKMPRNIGPVHFVGIGGIGMSGIAEILHNQGYKVHGSDSAENPNVQRLRGMGIEVEIGQAAENLERRCGRRHLVGDQEGQSRAGRGTRRAACRWCGAPRCLPRSCGSRTPLPSAARMARRRPRRWSRPCSMPAISIRPSSMAASSMPMAPMRAWAAASGWWSRPTRATAPSSSCRPTSPSSPISIPSISTTTTTSST